MIPEYFYYFWDQIKSLRLFLVLCCFSQKIFLFHISTKVHNFLSLVDIFRGICGFSFVCCRSFVCFRRPFGWSLCKNELFSLFFVDLIGRRPLLALSSGLFAIGAVVLAAANCFSTLVLGELPHGFL